MSAGFSKQDPVPRVSSEVRDTHARHNTQGFHGREESS